MSKPKTTARNLESRFEAGEDVLDYFDTAKAVRRNHAKARINLDLPEWMSQPVQQSPKERRGTARRSRNQTETPSTQRRRGRREPQSFFFNHG